MFLSGEHTIISLLVLVALFSSFAINVFLFIRLRNNPISWEVHGNLLRQNFWEIKDTLILFIAIIAIQIACIIPINLFSQWRRMTEYQTQTLQLSITSILFPLVSIVILIYIARLRDRSPKDFLCLNSGKFFKNIFFGAFCYISMLVYFMSCALISYVLLRSAGYIILPQESVMILLGNNHPNWLKIQLVIIAIVIAPIVEEIIFRGVALTVALKHFSTIPATCCVSLLFAAMHFHIPSLLPLFAFSLVSSLAYIYSGSLVVPITIHSLFNGINILLLFLIGDVTKTC